MPVTVSIRERICREVAAIMTASGLFGTVRRWDTRGLSGLARGDCIISDGEEKADDASIGNPGTTLKTMSLDVCASVAIDESTAEKASAIVNRTLALIEKALMADPTLVETTTAVRLAVDTRCTGSGAVPVEEGQPEVYAIVGFEIQYEHDRNNPSVGPGITEVTE